MWYQRLSPLFQLCLVASSFFLTVSKAAISGEDVKTKPSSKGSARFKNFRAYEPDPLPGSRLIVSIKPEGTVVAKGDLICELDATDLRDALTLKRIESDGLEAEIRNVDLRIEAADLELNELSAIGEEERTAKAEEIQEAVVKDETSEVDALRGVREGLVAAKAEGHEARTKEEAIRKEIVALETSIAQAKIYAKSDGRVSHAHWRPHPSTPEGYAILESGSLVIEGQPLVRVAAPRQPSSERGKKKKIGSRRSLI